MLTATTKSIQYGAHTLTLETGEIGRQADAAVLVRYGDTVVLVSAVAKTTVKEGQDFFPLTVDYQEKTYAAGKIPGGFFKREGRPSEKETLTSRLIDRPIRPLFPEGFYNEIQVIATVMSLDPEIDSDIPAIIGASAALYLAGVPFAAPIGAARVGYANGQYILNPTMTERKTSEMDLIVAATETAVMMVESDATELPEAVMLEAIWWGQAQQRVPKLHRACSFTRTHLVVTCCSNFPQMPPWMPQLPCTTSLAGRWCEASSPGGSTALRGAGWRMGFISTGWKWRVWECIRGRWF